MRTIKILLSILLLIILVLIIALGSLFLFLDPNKLKPIIANEVSRNTGFQTTINGKLSWSFYPLLGVKLDSMTLKESGQPAPFLEMHDVSIATELSQLLQGQSELQGQLYIQSAQLDKLHLERIAVRLGWKNHILTLQPLKASLYGGSLRGMVRGYELSATPKWDVDMQANNVDLQSLLADVVGKNSKLTLSGNSYLRFIASTYGREKNALLNHLNGTCQFNVKDGLVDGIDFNYFVTSANALINHEGITAPSAPFKTAFDTMSGLLTIKQGVATTDNILLQSSAFTVKGSGDLNLVSQSLDLKLQLEPLQQAKKEWLIPVIISGDINNPSVRLDTLAINALITKDELEKLKDKAQEEIKKLPEKADKFIGKLLGN